MGKINRREFLRNNAAATLGIALAAGGVSTGSESKSKTVRIGMVGTGKRGLVLLTNLVQVDGVEVPAICDIDAANAEAARDIVVSSGVGEPELYTKDEYSFKSLMEREDIDAVIIAAPWRWHTPMSVYGMKSGKYVGVEVPACQTVKECWELVNTSEETGVPCMMLENGCFLRENLSVLNMIRAGIFGETVHCYCAHTHDCIDHWFFDPKTGRDLWPAKYLVNRNRDQYPTHQLGPVISWLDIGCGDYFDYITSTASASRGINDYFKRKFGAEHPSATREYAQGDIVTTVIRTKKGKTIVDVYDMQLPRPFDNPYMVQGTRGIYSKTGRSIYIVDESPRYHEWEPVQPYVLKYEHRWWKEFKKKSLRLAGHGGIDYIELELFVKAVREKTQTPIDVYDSVLMSVPGPLSEKSISDGSEPVEVPDFTRGKWKTKKPSFGI